MWHADIGRGSTGALAPASFGRCKGTCLCNTSAFHWFTLIDLEYMIPSNVFSLKFVSNTLKISPYMISTNPRLILLHKYFINLLFGLQDFMARPMAGMLSRPLLPRRVGSGYDMVRSLCVLEEIVLQIWDPTSTCGRLRSASVPLLGTFRSPGIKWQRISRVE